MTQYASPEYEIYGIDYNEKMLEVTHKKIDKRKLQANLTRGNVEDLPYADDSFDTVINTMAFTGYPDGEKAMSELKRVLKPGGKLLLVDFDFPANRNVFGYWFVRLWEKFGDIIKDINALLHKNKFDFKATSVGGFGSVQLFIAHKKQ
jgi:ubiquinone/menaquinone biosynthesis C-methylase UbiE